MPETMRVMACVEAPLGQWRGWHLGLPHGVFHPLDSRRADLHVRDVLEFPGQTFRPQPRLRLDEAAGFLLHLPCETSGRLTGGRPFGQARQLATMAQALDGTRRRRPRASLGMGLRRTPGRMAL